MAAPAARSAPADAAVGDVWTPMCPGGGGWCMGIYPHPTNPDIVWMNTDISGLYRSTDGGKTYRLMSEPMHLATGGGYLLCGTYSQFAIDPTAPNVCYYSIDTRGREVHDNGLWKSEDEGDHWSYVAGTEALRGASITVAADGTLYCAQKDSRNLYVSIDQGKTFRVKATLPFIAATLKNYQTGIHLVSAQSGRLYAASPLSPETGLYYTDDRGDHWQSVAALAGQTVGAIACSPSDPKLVLAATVDGTIYRSVNSTTFTRCSGKLTPDRVDYKRSVALGISKSGRVVAWANGMAKPLLSDDQGRTFSDTKVGPKRPGDYLFFDDASTGLTSFAASPCSNRLYKTDAGTVWRSLDNGETWEPRVSGINIICLISPPVPDAVDPNRVYFLAADMGFYYTPDLGKTWKTSGGSDDTYCQAAGLAQDPANPNILYRVWSPVNYFDIPCYLYKSTDRGSSWHKIETANLGSRYRLLGSLIVDPTDPRHIYYSSTADARRNIPPRAVNAVLESTDGGTTFHAMPGSPAGLNRLVRARSGNLYGLQDRRGGAVYKYTLATNTWEVIYGNGATDFAVDPANEKVILVANFVGGKLMLSRDGGAAWKARKDSIGKDICANSVYIDPFHPGVMLACAHNIHGGIAGIVRSLDGGKTWSSFHGPNSPAYVFGFTYGGVPGRVYAWSCLPGLDAYRTDNVYAPYSEFRKTAPGVAAPGD